MAGPKPGRAIFGPSRAVADFDVWPGPPEVARVLAWLGLACRALRSDRPGPPEISRPKAWLARDRLNWLDRPEIEVSTVCDLGYTLTKRLKIISEQ